jgi:XTP/dITP diphosphohydrolase
MSSPSPADHTRLAQAVEVMDTLRSPGGCAWDAEQTHQSLTRYLLEEAYEVLEAIEGHPEIDYALLREELGDLLLQVLFHARIASERPAEQGGFDIEDVAGDLVDKLVRRHPHVFEEPTDADSATLNETWEKQKIAEKGRTSAADGVPLAQPALALAGKLVSRANRADLVVEEPVGHLETTTEAAIGAQLFAIVQQAVAAGIDPEGALRRTALTYRESIRAAEAAAD